MSDDPAKRKLKVTSVKEVHRGTNNKGEYVLSEVKAEDENGVVVAQKLNTFASLEEHIGNLVNYTIEVYEKDGERHFTLYPPRKRGANLGPKVDEIRDNVAKLREEFDSFREEVSGRLDELEKGPDF